MKWINSERTKKVLKMIIPKSYSNGLNISHSRDRCTGERETNTSSSIKNVLEKSTTFDRSNVTDMLHIAKSEDYQGKKF